MSDLDALLQAQDLTLADLEDNRAGKVSLRQGDQVRRHRAGLSKILAAGLGTVLVGTLGFTIYDYTRNHKPTVFILPAAAVVFAIALTAVFVTVLMLPAVAGKAVTVVEGTVDGFLAPSNNGYTVAIHHERYQGVARTLTRELVPNGRAIKAYVAANTTLVVAIEPA